MYSKARLGLFVLLIAGVVALIVSSIGAFVPQPQQGQMMSGMQGMMGGGTAGMPSSPYLWPSTFTISLAILISVVGYILAFPAIRLSPTAERKQVPDSSKGQPMEPHDPLGVVMRVLKPDERAALEVLRNSGGVCLQKDITRASGLSKLKTHRVVARLAERGVIEVRRVGNTNQITVPNWLKKPDKTP